MGLSLGGGSGKEDEARNTGDHRVLDRMPFLLSIVVGLLRLGIDKTRDLPLRTFMYEFVAIIPSATFIKKVTEGGEVGCRKHTGLYDHYAKNFCKYMNHCPHCCWLMSKQAA